MAQASTAQQREPSMEEILASIRRIIEDSESGRKDDHPQERETTFRSLSDIEALRPSFSAVSPLAPPNVIVHEPADSPEDAAEWSDEAPQAPQEQPTLDNFEADADEEGEDFAMPIAANMQIPPVPSQEESPAPQQHHAGNPPHVHLSETERRPIISRAPGRKVAAAFEELNEALIANRRKTLDQMAEDMLRPMLQDWLDNNLPQLVERLVREEIERIARGI